MTHDGCDCEICEVMRDDSPERRQFQDAQDARDAAALARDQSDAVTLRRQVEVLRDFARKVADWTMHSGSQYDGCIDYADRFYLMESEITEARGLAKAALAATAPATDGKPGPRTAGEGE